MTVRQLATLVSRHEGRKRQVNIAQISEVLKVTNKLLKGAVYRVMAEIPFEDKKE